MLIFMINSKQKIKQGIIMLTQCLRSYYNFKYSKYDDACAVATSSVTPIIGLVCSGIILSQQLQEDDKYSPQALSAIVLNGVIFTVTLAVATIEILRAKKYFEDRFFTNIKITPDILANMDPINNVQMSGADDVRPFDESV